MLRGTFLTSVRPLRSRRGRTSVFQRFLVPLASPLLPRGTDRRTRSDLSAALEACADSTPPADGIAQTMDKTQSRRLLDVLLAGLAPNL
jgi:hypothetical protein